MPWDEKGSGGNNKGPWGPSPQGNDNGNPQQPPQNPDIEKLLLKGQEKILKMLRNVNGGGGGGGKNKPPSGNSPVGNIDNNIIIIAVAAVAFVVWILSGVYTVNTKEAGVVLRFGKYVSTSTPGLNWHFPAPIETVIKLSVTDRYKTEIGLRPEKARSSHSKTEVKSNDDLLMLTGDENLVDVNFEVQWQITDANKFLFNVYDPQLTVRNAAESAMREMIGKTPLSEILSEGRSILQQKTKELVQSILDSYDAGIQIEAINMRGVPPKSAIKVDNVITGEDGEMKSESITTTVDQAFKDVQAAIINKEEIINMAIARSNEVIPEARGQGQKLIQEAHGYKEQVIAMAQGEANRFNAVYNEYKKAKDVTKTRMYLETMEQVMEGMDKIIMDGKNSGVIPYLPMKELGAKQ